MRDLYQRLLMSRQNCGNIVRRRKKKEKNLRDRYHKSKARNYPVLDTDNKQYRLIRCN